MVFKRISQRLINRQDKKKARPESLAFFIEGGRNKYVANTTQAKVAPAHALLKELALITGIPSRMTYLGRSSNRCMSSSL